ncbi:ABC transporter permease [Lysinibacter sp. HNR]|uniref:ABC transporter permease n=1 Tax=Lysinibacter sp. HNR TaxID=3031408 RepID=UPI0024355EDA|nr:ABC transporter permease [Lysinibacter sp. HNR]WGD37908.1 ABC transporter permease [Lysinibacter sp. HNR]
MTTYLLRRLLFLLLSLIAAMVVIFVLLRLLPGDPANALLSVDATPEQIAAARAEMGSDRPLFEQFVSWVGQIVTLDLGNSFVSGQPVLPEVLSRLQVTLPLTFISFVIATILSLVIGFIAGYRADRWYGTVLSGFAQLGVAVPVFWVGILLVWAFALGLQLLPSGGFPRTEWADPGRALTSLILPVATIVIVMTASLSRYVRSATVDVVGSDYLRTSRALGSSFGQAMLMHGVRNGSVPVIAILGIELATTFLGAVVVESVFTLPGIGSMLLQAIAQHDYPSIQAVLLFSTIFVLLVGFIADIAQRLVDPRLRTSISGNR